MESSSESDSDSDEADYRQIDAQESWRSHPASVSEGRLPLRQFQIFLSGVHGRTITLEVALDDTVDTVFSKIQDKEGVPCNGPHRIVYRGRTLQRHNTLADYDVYPDTTLQMLSLPRGGSGKHTSETATGTSSSDGDGDMGQALPTGVKQTAGAAADSAEGSRRMESEILPAMNNQVEPLHVPIRIDIGGTVFRTSLHTLMEGALLGGNYFWALCHNILRPGEPAGSRPWDLLVVPAQNQQYGMEHFVDADPTTWPCWLEYLRSGLPREVPFVEAGPLRDRIIRDTRRAGLAELADGLAQLVTYQ